jgi:hypothetical protein
MHFFTRVPFISKDKKTKNLILGTDLQGFLSKTARHSLVCSFKNGCLFQQLGKDVTCFANFQLISLRSIQGAFTQCTGQEPAEMAALKFPCGALLFYIAVFLLPAWGKTVLSSPLIDKQKIKMSFNMGRNCSPALFITVNGFQ